MPAICPGRMCRILQDSDVYVVAVDDGPKIERSDTIFVISVEADEMETRDINHDDAYIRLTVLHHGRVVSRCMQKCYLNEWFEVT